MNFSPTQPLPLALLLLMTVASVGVHAAPAKDEPPRLVVRLIQGEERKAIDAPQLIPDVLVEGELVAPAARLASEQTIRVPETGIIITLETNLWLSVSSPDENLLVVVDGFFACDSSGCRTRILAGNRAAFRVDWQYGVMGVRTPFENLDPVPVSFPDGGSMELQMLAEARIEWFEDCSYLAGAGGANRPGSVRAVNAEGRVQRPCETSGAGLTADTPPMTGGPLVGAVDDRGMAYNRRLTPTLPVVIDGRLGEWLSIQVGDQTETVVAGASQTVRTDNGSVITFHHESNPRRLVWSARKGDFRIRVKDILGWQVVGWSGRSAAMQWDMASRVVDLVNLDGEIPLLVTLPGGKQARVGPGALFQYGVNDSFSFKLAGNGGSVSLLDARTCEEAPLERTTLLRVAEGSIISEPAGAPRTSGTGAAGSTRGAGGSGSSGAPPGPTSRISAERYFIDAHRPLQNPVSIVR